MRLVENVRNSKLKKMTHSSLQNLVKFLETAGRLKRTLRAGWIDVGIRQPESVADHTFRTAILCMIYADMKGLDQLKMLRMALIHDLPEAIIGDLTPSKKTEESKDRETAAINEILDLLPETQKKKFLTDWNEYQEGMTKEAKAVRQLEKLEMALQAKEYEKAKTTDHSLKRFIKSAEKAITTPELRRTLSYILEEQRR
jgi:putative hydrolase of HD superfamily